MRLWTLHPKYLDPRGLVALWREALLAQKVLRGETVGYKNHPQLYRFREQPDPLASIARFLGAVHAEAGSRGYHFAADKIGAARTRRLIVETEGQLLYEWEHLKNKLRVRHPERFEMAAKVGWPEPHPLFRIVAGPVRDWERVLSNQDS